MKAADGKIYMTQAADTEGVLRIIQSIPSKKAEPLTICHQLKRNKQQLINIHY